MDKNRKLAHPEPCCHRGEPVRVGPYEILAGGMMYLRDEDLAKATVLVPLTKEYTRLAINGRRVVPMLLPDFGGVPDNWGQLLETEIIPLLEQKEKVLAFCTASRGRTGTFLASLIARLESPEETPDPIAAVRERHCHHAVETKKQAEAIFALRGQALPEKYQREFGRGTFGAF